MEETLKALKSEADDLGIKYNPNIGEAKLKEKIEAHYKAQETGAPKIIEESAASKAEAKVNKLGEMIKKAEADAKKTTIVTITDNDPRENNLTTTVTVTCVNEYFDLGTKTVPLNTPVELEQGFINVLKEIRIPMHIRDLNSQQSKTVVRNRYSIQVDEELRKD